MILKRSIHLNSKISLSEGVQEDVVLIHFIWSFAFRPNKMITLRYINLKTKIDKKIILYYEKKMNRKNLLFLKNFIPKLKC